MTLPTTHERHVTVNAKTVERKDMHRTYATVEGKKRKEGREGIGCV